MNKIQYTIVNSGIYNGNLPNCQHYIEYDDSVIRRSPDLEEEFVLPIT
jgi:hypothetical protein